MKCNITKICVYLENELMVFNTACKYANCKTLKEI